MTLNKQLAFVFPGQGSQSVGMMRNLAEHYPDVQTGFIQASELLGYDLWDLVESGPESELNITAKTQPVLLVGCVAIWNLWNKKNGQIPAIMAGHSLGEYSALVCSGALNFTDAVTLVAERGRYMQEAVPEGTGSMAAILGLDNNKITDICAKASEGQIVSAANYNSTGQVVIAGHVEAVKRAMEIANHAGAKRTIILPVSVPSHCALMLPAARYLAARLVTIHFNDSKVPVIHNVDLESKVNAASIRQALTEQLYKPVRWVDTIEMMKTRGITQIVECGPGKVLSGLIKRIDRTIETFSIQDSESLDKTLSVISS
jgi:[acyl-carrier-protein] S-malonyltransferase